MQKARQNVSFEGFKVSDVVEHHIFQFADDITYRV